MVMNIIVFSILFIVVIILTIIVVCIIKKKQFNVKVEKLQYKYPRAFIEFVSENNKLPFSNANYFLLKKIAKRPEIDWKQSERNLIKQEQKIKNIYKDIKNSYPNGLNKWKEQNPNATKKDIVLNVSKIIEKEQEIRNAQYLKTIDMIREKYPLAYKEFVSKNNISISDTSKSLKNIVKQLNSWIEEEKKHQKREQKKLELENQYKFIKNHYPEGLEEWEKYNPNSTKEEIIKNKFEIIKYQHNYQLIIEQITKDAEDYDKWENEQAEFTRKCYNISKDTLIDFGRYSYNIFFQKVVCDGSHTLGNYKVWQFFPEAYCLEYDLDYTDFKDIKQNTDNIDGIKNARMHYLPFVYEKIKIFINALCKEYDVSIYLCSNNNEWSKEALYYHYFQVEGTPFKCFPKSVEVSSFVSADYNNGKLLNHNEYPSLKNRCIVIVDMQTDNNQLKNVCKNIIEKNKNLKPLITYISLLKGFDREEMIELIEKRKKEHNYIIESNTKYATLLKNTALKFQAIKNISVAHFYKYSDKDEIFQSLGRGNNVLKEEAQLYSYLNSYGNMHEAKMLSALQKFPFDILKNKHIEFLDWACGQGLASIVILEYLRNQNITLPIDKIILIEPSEIALKRAALHVRHFDSQCEIKTVLKDIDSVQFTDIQSNTNAIKIHLFSNILDVDGFSLEHLISLVEQTQKGNNYFVCVSPYITDAKTARIDEFVQHFANNYNSYKTYYEVENRKGDWINEWTRVIRVFKVNL